MASARQIIGSRHCDPACTAGAGFDDAILPTAGRTTGRSSRSIPVGTILSRIPDAAPRIQVAWCD